jgi:hypothetical protein
VSAAPDLPRVAPAYAVAHTNGRPTADSRHGTGSSLAALCITAATPTQTVANSAARKTRASGGGTTTHIVPHDGAAARKGVWQSRLVRRVFASTRLSPICVTLGGACRAGITSLVKEGRLIMPALSPLIAWLSACVLGALFARSVARLLTDRASSRPGGPNCGRTSRLGEVTHAAMALGMAGMVLPVGLPAVLLVGFFAVVTTVVAGSWAVRWARLLVAHHRDVPPPCPPAHALEPHHIIVGLAMAAMAARVRGGMQARGMEAMGGSPDELGVLSLAYIWIAVLLLGLRMARAVSAQPPTVGAAAMLSAPAVVYACELAMTVVMGLMLLG